MARRRRVAQPVEDARYLQWRCHALVSSCFRAIDPDDSLEAKGAAIRWERIHREAGRIGGLALPVGERLAVLEAFLAEEGELAYAERHIEALLASRARWAAPGDFSLDMNRKKEPHG